MIKQFLQKLGIFCILKVSRYDKNKDKVKCKKKEKENCQFSRRESIKVLILHVLMTY